MNFSGLTDLPEDAAKQCARCRCGSLARVGSGLCVSCLLRTGLISEEGALAEDFDAILAAVDVPDRDWQLGSYRILEEIGRGGMGVIYRARHLPSQRVVALKRVLNYHSDSNETLVRFQREATAAASLDHPNILPIYDVGTTDDGLPFFSMKFAAGGSLLEWRRNFQSSPRRAVELIAAVARAVDYAHKQGILHRDLKPGNILLDARGAPLVSDFGLAKWLDTTSDLTGTLTVFGTPGYIAPEQSGNLGAELTSATDVYSIGAILFELLAGRPPFLGEHAVAVIRQAAENDAPKLRTVVPNASRDLETICARCLEREPIARYQTAIDLAEDLERWLEGRPIRARPISPAAKLYRWSRRNPMLALSVAVCLVFAGTLITRQVQSWKLENTIRQNELARNSIAVLPLLDLDNAREDSNWTVSLAQNLQRNLSRVGNARVVVATNTADMATAARNFQTRAVLSGTRRKTNNGTQISIRLLEPNGDELLTHIVDLAATSADPNAFTKQLAPKIYAILNANDWSGLIASHRDPGLQNEEARELISAGRELTFHYTVRDFDRAISCFEKAIRIEPRSALAHAYLASAAAGRSHYLADADGLAYARQQVERATELAPRSAEVLRVLAGVKYQQGQSRDALNDGLNAMETAPPNGKNAALVAMVYDELGRPEKALRWFQLAKRIDPRPGEYECHIGDCWTILADYDKARTAYQRANDLHPERAEGLIGISRLCLLNADFVGARNLCRQSLSLNPDGSENRQLAAQIEFFARNFSVAQKLYAALEQKDPDGGGSFYGSVSYQSALGRIARISNAHSGAAKLQTCLQKELKQLQSAPENPDVLYRLAAIESSLGQTEPAIAYLQHAVAAGWTDYRSLSLDPRFDSVADDARFQMILGRLKLKMEELRRQITNDP